jgi:hypothetical protein
MLCRVRQSTEPVPLYVDAVLVHLVMLFSGANLEQWLDDPAVTNAFYDLSDEASKKKGQGDFDKLFAKFLVDWNIPVAAGTAFLHALHRKQCQIDFATLPRDSRTLTKVMT